MTRVHLLTEDGSQSSIAFNFPLRLHARLLAEHGLDVKLFDPSAGPEALACDVLFVNSNYFGSQWPGADDRVRQVLEDGRARAGRVVWFDTSASSGTAQFEVLPLVDLYCKAQVLVDRSDYLKEHHGDRVFTDYYFSRDGVRDEDGVRTERARPSPGDLERIRVSWSTALGDFGVLARRYRRFGRYLPAFRRYSARFTAPERKRSVKVACRLGLAHRRTTVLHHRKLIKEVVERDFGTETHPIPREEYLDELKRARVGISPFGYGEVCFRDFEVILAGAALVKPDMSHLETWPPLYVDGESYLAHRWDASDLKEVIERLLAGDAWRTVSSRAQQVYRRYLFEPAGHVEFVTRVAGIVRASKRTATRAPGPADSARLPR
jgi:hypothetical protein